MKKHWASLMTLLIVFLFCLAPFSTAVSAEEADEEQETLAERFAGKSIGVLTDSVYDQIAEQTMPDGETVAYNTISDLAPALDMGKIDAYIADTSLVSRLTAEYRDHKVEAELSKEQYGFIFPKDGDETLCEQFNAFLKEMRSSGEMREVMQIWFGRSEAGKTVDSADLKTENGILHLAVSTDVGDPFAYVKDDRYVGFDVDLAVRFCREYGYGLEIEDSNFTGLLASVSDGRCDFGASTIAITEERRETVRFSEPYYEGSVSLVVKESEADAADYETLRGVRIGVVTGMILDVLSEELIPDCQVEYFNSNADLGLALETGKIDAYMTDEPVARILLGEYADQLTYALVSRDSYGYIFPKGDGESDLLRNQMNAFLQELRTNGTLREIDSIWFGSDEACKVVDLSDLTGENGTLRMAVSSGVGAPFCYLKDGRYVGYDIDIAARFCREYGYGLEFEDSSFGSMIAAVSIGRCDFGASCITITEERKESMNFSDANYLGGVVIVVRSEPEAVLEKLSDPSVYETLRGRAIGVLMGSIFADLAERTVPDCEVVQFNDNADLALALETGKIDGYMCDEPAARMLMTEYSDHRIFAAVSRDEYAYIYQKDSERGDLLRGQMNAFLAKLRADGILQEIDTIWLGTDASVQRLDYSGLTGENGTVTYVGTSRIGVPFFYLKEGQYVGYDVDIVVRFCREYGYALEILDVDFSALLASVSTGRADFGGASVTITEERKESVDFSDPNYYGGVVIVTKADLAASTGTEPGFFPSVRNSFDKTFLRENRWQLFASGIGVTLLITALSALCGTVLAFLLFLIYRKELSAPNLVIRILSDILQKTPVVVILMILYYILFSRSSLEGVWVSCIGFSLIFACSVLDVLRVAVNAVEQGQMEAALALGYNDTRAFLRVILPQAMEHFLPVYKGEIVTLIKSTAIVGYIAVQDLTKVSDIVRSRTYEAFFPLIASAVIYFALAWLLTLLVSRIQLRRNPKKRDQNRILRDLDTADDRGIGGAEIIGTQNMSGREGTAVIELCHLRKAYPNAVPLADVNSVVHYGDVISVIGPSGTGKSTLLRCIDLLNMPTSGQVLVDGVDITAPDCRISEMRRKIGMVFQSFNLFGHLTVIENVMLAPVDLLGLSRQEAYDRGMALLNMVGMNGRALHYPDMLSGGQKQRVAIARTLAMDPEIILFDEPTSALDPAMVGEVQAVIRELANMGKTMMIVTHEMQFAREISNRVLYLDRGGIYEDGTPEQIFDRPERELTRRFVRKLKVFEVKIEDRGHDFRDTVSALERYGYKNRIPPKTLYRIQSVFEELCQQILLPRFVAPRICFAVEYDDRQESAQVTVAYGGESFDPRQSENRLALSILEKMSDSLEYSYDVSESMANTIMLHIR